MDAFEATLDILIAGKSEVEYDGWSMGGWNFEALKSERRVVSRLVSLLLSSFA